MKNSYVFGQAIDAGEARRDKPNQDFIAVVEPSLLNPRPPLLILSDGMGAYGGGEIASRIVVQSFIRSYLQTFPFRKNWLVILNEMVHKAHHEIIQKAKGNTEFGWMGCTIIATVLTSKEVYLTNVGDSRAYLISYRGIRQISFDHSIVAEQVRRGLISPEEARTHPKRNVLSLSLSARRERVDPYLARVPWEKDETLLLCSDGLWAPVSEAEIQSIVLKLPPQKAAEKLVQIANLHHGPDNISVILARRRDMVNQEIQEEDTFPGFASLESK